MGDISSPIRKNESATIHAKEGERGKRECKVNLRVKKITKFLRKGSILSPIYA